MHRESIVIVTPALADANNGNWQTAKRWARLLPPAYRAALASAWSSGDEALMIALHARRSAASVAAWKAARPQAPLVLVLTGTDLYRDIDTDPAAQRSLALADALVVLNSHGPQRLPQALRPRCHVVLQSCSDRLTLPKTLRHLRALMVGHLREEKDPRTAFRAMGRLRARPDIRLEHVGAALDPVLGAEARALSEPCPAYRWLGGLPHAQTRRRIQAAHLLVHPSRMEGGAHVVIEAVRSGTPVLASRIDGNTGLLGDDWPGLFEAGDDGGLARLLVQARDDPDMLPGLQSRLAALSPLFSPEAERGALLRIVARLLHPDTRGRTDRPPSGDTA
jgi:putative glycosyltransferase (TIGR04348 family)